MQITIKHDEYTSKTFEGYYGTSGDSFDVNIPGEAWMIWVKASGFVVLCKNSSLVEITNAASYARVVLGTRVYLKAIVPGPATKLQLDKFKNLFNKAVDT